MEHVRFRLATLREGEAEENETVCSVERIGAEKRGSLASLAGEDANGWGRER